MPGYLHNKKNQNTVIIIILLIGLTVKLTMINYGMPYLFHPDEPYIFKDPFKLLYNYKNLTFSGTTNLFFWVIIGWYSLYFIGGLLTGNIGSLEEFQQLLIAEDPSVIVFGRLLSIVMSLAGSYFILQIIRRITGNSILLLLLGLTLIFNPIELISNLWIKFDPAVYLSLSFLLYKSYLYFIEGQKRLRNQIYILCFLALSVRIDLLAFFIAFLSLDFYLYGRTQVKKKYVASLIKPFTIGTILYLLISMLPFFLLYRFGQTHNHEISVAVPFETAIVTKYSKLSFGSLIGVLLSNMGFYSYNCILMSLGPLLLSFILFWKQKKNDTRVFGNMLLLLLTILAIPLALFSYHAPHYFLPSSLAIILISFLGITALKNMRIQFFLASITLFYFASLSLQIMYQISSCKDTRLQASEYLLESTTKSDLIAIEKYLNAGFFPPIDECKEVLLEKVRATQKYNMGTGETLKFLAGRSDSGKCRSILEISFPKRFAGTEYENKWAIDYSPSLFISKSPDVFISMEDYSKATSNDSFAVALWSHYKMVKQFSISFADPRVQPAITMENFFPTFYVYKKKNPFGEQTLN